MQKPLISGDLDTARDGGGPGPCMTVCPANPDNGVINVNKNGLQAAVPPEPAKHSPPYHSPNRTTPS